jgi:hypothetical protein
MQQLDLGCPGEESEDSDSTGSDGLTLIEHDPVFENMLQEPLSVCSHPITPHLLYVIFQLMLPCVDSVHFIKLACSCKYLSAWVQQFHHTCYGFWFEARPVVQMQMIVERYAENGNNRKVVHAIAFLVHNGDAGGRLREILGLVFDPLSFTVEELRVGGAYKALLLVKFTQRICRSDKKKLLDILFNSPMGSFDVKSYISVRSFRTLYERRDDIEPKILIFPSPDHATLIFPSPDHATQKENTTSSTDPKAGGEMLWGPGSVRTNTSDQAFQSAMNILEQTPSDLFYTEPHNCNGPVEGYDSDATEIHELLSELSDGDMTEDE